MTSIIRTTMLILVLLLVSSCGATFYQARFPELDKPERPKLVNIPGDEMKKMSDEARLNTIGNFNKLINYSRKLEGTIDIYNSHAKEQNKILNTISNPDKEKKPGLIKRVFGKD